METGQRAQLLRSTLTSWLPRGSPVAIVDVPVHRNIGDLFIYAVTDSLLRDLGCSVVYRAGVWDYRTAAARRIPSDTVIVGLGGGNFGDLYPRYQSLRELVVATFPDHRIVILPQTIHYTLDETRASSTAALRRHPALFIGARDARSLALAREITPHSALLPDLVDALGAHTVSALATEEPSGGARTDARGGRGTLYLLRQDREKADQDAGAREQEGAVSREDWRTLVPGVSIRVAAAALTMRAAPFSASALLHDRWRQYAAALFARTVDRLRRYDHVVTDRLHGAILARLAGCPVTLIDNSYGKVAAYYHAWWTDDRAVTFERSDPCR